MISAKEARRIANESHFIDPEELLFKEIEKAAKDGQTMILFDEEEYCVKFEEDRKVVAAKLTELGYKVTYRRVQDSDNYFGEHYHNCYIISWEE